MDTIKYMQIDQHEQVVYCNEPHTGLKAIIAIHNTLLGPALGGCRFYPYASTEDALIDALRLSKGMTYKAVMAGLNLGGGKSVIIGDPKKLASEALFRVFGRFVASLGGRYITAEDVGTSVKHMEWVRLETKHVTGVPAYFGGSGDPSPFTAHGVFVGILATVQTALKHSSLQDVKVAVQGVGNVGYHLCKELHEAGAKLYITDVDHTAVKRVVDEFGATSVKVDKIYSQEVDVYAPCALGATVNDKTIPQLKCAVVAGAANNQLADEKKHGKALLTKGILYAPDYVINAGGLINVSQEISGGGPEYARTKTEGIYDTLMNIYQMAEESKIPTHEAANKMAEERLQAIAKTRNVFVRDRD